MLVLPLKFALSDQLIDFVVLPVVGVQNLVVQEVLEVLLYDFVFFKAVVFVAGARALIEALLFVQQIPL